MVPTTLSGEASRISTPMRVPRCPAEKRAGRSTPSAAYSSMTSCGNFTYCCSPMGPAPFVLITRPAFLSKRSVGCRLFQTYDDGLAGRGVTGVRGGVQRHQDVGLRVVGGGAAACRRVVHDAEAGRPALDAVLPLADQVDVRAVGDAQRACVLGV